MDLFYLVIKYVQWKGCMKSGKCRLLLVLKTFDKMFVAPAYLGKLRAESSQFEHQLSACYCVTTNSMNFCGTA